MIPVKYHARQPRPLITASELQTLAIGFVAGAVVVAAISKPRRITCILDCGSKILDAIIAGKI
jgi:hypothetical protein